MRTHRILTVLGTITAALALAAAPSFAGSPHFIKNATKVSFDGTSLVIQFKEAGLESGSVETITVSAHLDATYQCINNGNHNPDDPKKTVLDAEVSESGEFEAAKNGNVVGSLTLSPPAASDVLDCPNGQTETLTAVTWSDVSITDEDTGAFLALAGTFSAGSPID